MPPRRYWPMRGTASRRKGRRGRSHILFSKPANAEQYEIATRLAKSKAVLVQGPPGTGKTHTIANLLGCLLSQGKTVLVTAHATKTLRVLRRHVDESLRPLCLSVLEGDADSQARLAPHGPGHRRPAFKLGCCEPAARGGIAAQQATEIARPRLVAAAAEPQRAVQRGGRNRGRRRRGEPHRGGEEGEGRCGARQLDSRVHCSRALCPR